MTNWDEIDSAWCGHEFFAQFLVARVKPKVIVDVGTYKGYSAMCFARPNIGTVYTIDNKDYGQAENLKDFKNVKCIIGDSKETSKTFTEFIDVLHIDGSHSLEDITSDIESWLPKLRPFGVLLMHDVFNLGTPYPAIVFNRIKYGLMRELSLYKRFFLHSNGLGIMTTDLRLINDIDDYYRSSIVDEDNMKYIRWHIGQIVSSMMKGNGNGKDTTGG